MQQIRALQEMVRNQPARGSENVLDSVEMKVLQRNLDAAQAELQKTESRLSEINQSKSKVEQNLLRSRQELDDLQKSMNSHIATQSEGQQIELDALRAELSVLKQSVGTAQRLHRRKKPWRSKPTPSRRKWTKRS